MKCKKVIKNSNRYFDNILSKQEKSDIEKHLRICNKCKEYYEDKKEFFKLLRSESLINPPKDFTQKILKITKEDKHKHKEKDGYFWPAIARSMVMAGIVSLILNFTSVDIYSNIDSIYNITSNLNSLFIKYSHSLGDYLSIFNGGII